MDSQILNKLAQSLFDAETARTQTENPAALYPGLTSDDAYYVQDAMVKLRVKGGLTPHGYKIGSTLCAKWEKLGIKEPFYGIMFKERIYEGAEKLPYSAFILPRLETEIVFVLKDDIKGPAVNAQKVVDATDYVTAALEIVDTRTPLDGKTINDIIADGGAFGACLMNTERKNLKSFDLNAENVKVTVNGNYRETGNFIDVMHGPVNSIVWLAERLLKQGDFLKRGDIILSGSGITPFRINKGDKVELEYSSLGHFEFELS